MSKQDLETIKESLYSFLYKKDIKNKLSHILAKGTNDWEKWLQIEFEYFLENDMGYIAKREIRALTDKRHNTGRSHLFVDLIFRKKGTRLDRFIYLELKLGMRSTELINKMWIDMLKNDEILNSQYKKNSVKRRSFWSVGFYRDFGKTSIKRTNDALDGYKDDHYLTHHDTIYVCRCRGKKHTEECQKTGLIIIGFGSGM
ncbi:MULTISPECIES: hypothetical protein [Pectobacterium]|uniref:hypothetical protein n=1 Tax=Pectobacterium TaxID=122277 RepID=UPI000DCFAA12|nr:MULTISPECIES: hypothetical protein [Pectobacterium]